MWQNNRECYIYLPSLGRGICLCVDSQLAGRSRCCTEKEETCHRPKEQGRSVPPIADKVLLAENCSVRTKKPSLPSIQLTHVENLRVFVRLKMRSKSIFNLTSSFLIHVNAGKIWLAWQRDNDRVLD